MTTTTTMKTSLELATFWREVFRERLEVVGRLCCHFATLRVSVTNFEKCPFSTSNHEHLRFLTSNFVVEKQFLATLEDRSRLAGDNVAKAESERTRRILRRRDRDLHFCTEHRITNRPPILEGKNISVNSFERHQINRKIL